jgi:DNA-directed RNA polymerase subunit M/transcription elongation factor TFIIS
MRKEGIKFEPKNTELGNDFFIQHQDQSTKLAVESGAETCPRCNSNKIVSIDVQKRSADEAMTTLFECSVCNKKWQI